MSMRSVLGVIGGIVGAYFGYPQLGFIAGSLIGAALEPGKNTQGPRLDDLKVTVSTYGVGIPTVYGTMRIGGNAIWSTDKTEIGTTTTQGKGGAPTNTSFRYFVSMMLGLFRTPAPGTPIAMRKAWQDGKLNYDASSGISVGSALATAENPFAAIAILPGFEDELPVPQIEQVEGIGNVPAYLGLTKMFIFGLETPGGRIPQISAEMCVNPGFVVERLLMGSSGCYGALVTSEGAYALAHIAGPPTQVVVTQVGSGYATNLRTINLPTDHLTVYTRPVIGSDPPMGIRPSIASDGTYTITLVDLTQGLTSALYSDGGDPAIDFKGGAAYDSVSQQYAVLLTTAASNQSPIIIQGPGVAVACDPLVGFGGPLAFYNGSLYALAEDGGILSLVTYNLTGAAVSTVAVPAGSWDTPNCAIQANANGLYLYLAVQSVAQASIYKSVDGDWQLLCDAVLPGGGSSPTVNMSFFTDDNRAVIGPVSSGDFYLIRYKALQPTAASVADIITDQCVRGGLTTDRIDVSSIDDTVWGYTITNPASARTNIQPLMTAFAIDATEEDGKIKFFKRADQVSVATIGYDELACAEDGAQPGDPMPLTRGQEAELPRSIAVSYPNPEFDYQTCTEKAIRQVTSSQLDQVVELSIAMTGDQAASIAQMLLNDAWNERDKRSFSVSRKYEWLNAGDIATIENPRGIFRQYRITKLTDTGATMQGECVKFDAGIYTQMVVGSSGGTGQVVAPLAPPTRQQILDIPILRDQDNNAGIYDALDGFGPDWTGAELFVGDDDTNLVSRGTVSAPAPIGYAETALATWTRNLVDETNLLTVNIGDDDFSSSTRDVLLSGGAEFWALGAPGRWEIGASAGSDDLGNGRYILSRHLRGLFGTEHYAGTHLAGDAFVMLRIAGMVRPSMSVGDLGQSKSYRAVSQGRSFDSTSSQTYVNTGEGLKPLSPVNLRRSTASNDITLTWDRRSRLAMNNSTGIVPLGEATESYSVEFYTSSAFTTLAGTLSSTTASLTITSAQQTAFGLTPGATVHVRVRQISDSVGNGHKLEMNL